MGGTGLAQYVQVDFEPGGLGADWVWIVGENADNPPLEFIANPDVSDPNTSATVAQFTARQTGQPWALCFTNDIDEFEFTADNSTITLMVHKPVISNVAVKFEGVGPAVEIQVPNTVTNQWEELTFDFSGAIGNQYSRLVIIPDFGARDADHVIYFDNIQLPAGNITPPAEPDVAAPTPTVPAEDVISLFSNAYENVPVDTWSADWDDADVEDVQIEGNDTKLYTHLNYAGIEFVSQTIDASTMSHFHMDIWTPDPTELPAVFRIKLVDFGADGAYGGGDDAEHELTFDANSNPPLITGEWIQFDIPLSAFTGLVTREHLAQLVISGDPNTVYVDNIYFYAMELTGSVLIDFEDGGLGADWEWRVFENQDNPPLEIIPNPDMSDPNASMMVAQFIARESGMDWAGFETTDIGEFTFNENNSIITLMVHKPVISDVRVKFEGASPPVEINVANTVTDQWEELTYDFSAYIGNTYNKLVIFPDFAPRDQDNVIYLDNILVPEGVLPPPPDEPEEPAPTPTLAAENVISLFSNPYPDVPVDTWSADWDAADVEDVQIEGNDTKLYTNLVYAGIEFISNPIDASDMLYFHMDIWTPDPTDLPAVFRIKLVDFGADGAYGGGDDSEHELTFDANSDPALVTREWVQFDIPLSAFTGLQAREHLAQLIISGDPNTVYVDNIYFYTDDTMVIETTAVATPAVMRLGQNYPNPFNPTTTIRFDLAQADYVTLSVYTIAGQEVATLVDGFQDAGSYTVHFKADQLDTGTYIYTLQTGDFTASKKMVLLK